MDRFLWAVQFIIEEHRFGEASLLSTGGSELRESLDTKVEDMEYGFDMVRLWCWPVRSS